MASPSIRFNKSSDLASPYHFPHPEPPTPQPPTPTNHSSVPPTKPIIYKQTRHSTHKSEAPPPTILHTKEPPTQATSQQPQPIQVTSQPELQILDTFTVELPTSATPPAHPRKSVSTTQEEPLPLHSTFTITQSSSHN